MSSSVQFPWEVWPENILQARIPANDNSLRAEAFGRGVLSDSTTAQPGSPTDGDIYIMPSSHTGAAWGGFTAGDVAIYRGGTWYGFTPTGKPMVNVAGVLKYWNGTIWATLSVGGPNVQSITSASTVTPTFNNDLVEVTALAAAMEVMNPSGTAVDGWGLVIRIKDNGTSRVLTYDTDYRAVGVTLPTATVANKTLYLGMIWNAADTKFDVTSVAQQA